MVWRASDPPGDEAGKIRWEIVQYTRGFVLDIGCGMHKAFPHFIGVDNCTDTRLFGHPIKPDVFVVDASELPLFASDSCDAVFSSHLLEHIEPKKVVKTLREWLRVVKPGGYLVLYLPDETLYPKIGEEGANPDHKWNVSYVRLVEAMQRTAVSWDLIEWQRRGEDREYSLYFVFRKLEASPKGKPLRQDFSCVKAEDDAKFWQGRRACVVRYGAYGDLLQASSVFAGLKAQGFHVTLMTSPPGDAVVKHDPNIDAFYLQDKDQVPNMALGDYWGWHKKKFDRWVNLSESVEGTFLALYPRSNHLASPRARHLIANVNYLEYQHALAGVPHQPAVRFYPTEDEKKWAKAERTAIGGAFCVLYALNGSSVHKRWPYMDQLIAALLLDFPELNIVLVGGPDGQILEQGWFAWDKDPATHEDAKKIQTEPRVHCRAGRWEIRQTLAFAELADLVFGPETGVLNACANLEMPKVLLLSHSSVENLCRDWVNTHALASQDTHCPGRGANEAPACHQMHYNFDHCKEADYPPDFDRTQLPEGMRDKKTGIAQCQQDLDFESVYKVVWHAVTWEKERQAAARPELKVVGG